MKKKTKKYVWLVWSRYNDFDILENCIFPEQFFEIKKDAIRFAETLDSDYKIEKAEVK